MRGRKLSIGTLCVSLAAASFTRSNPVVACGACVGQAPIPAPPGPPPPPPPPPPVVTTHRMVLAVSPTRTILWDQFEWGGDSGEFVWLLPVRASEGVQVSVGSDEFVSALDRESAPRLLPPACAQTQGTSGNGRTPLTSPVPVPLRSSNGVASPFEIVTIRNADAPSAVYRWLRSNGYSVTHQPLPRTPSDAGDVDGQDPDFIHGRDTGPSDPADAGPNTPSDAGADDVGTGSVDAGDDHDATPASNEDSSIIVDASEAPPEVLERDSTLDYYVTRGSDFIAVRLRPGVTVNRIQPIRVTLPGYQPVLPLRAIRLGSADLVSLELLVISSSRMTVENQRSLEPGAIAIAYNTTSPPMDTASDYTRALNDRARTDAYRSWFVESAERHDRAWFETTLRGTSNVMPDRVLDDARLALGSDDGAVVTRFRGLLDQQALDSDLILAASVSNAEIPRDRTYTSCQSASASFGLSNNTGCGCTTAPGVARSETASALAAGFALGAVAFARARRRRRNGEQRL